MSVELTMLVGLLASLALGGLTAYVDVRKGR